ncbi:MAG: N,N'-diacetylchitobiose phosphorylase [Oscillospiraceae bacterium]
MKYGYFDNENREYVIDRVNVPVSWTNYIGTEEMGAVVSQNAGGYLFYQSPENHRITRFRANALPLDRPGHYVYLRDDDTKDYWSISWQPVGKPLDVAKYECRHGLSYSKFTCDYNDIQASETLVIPIGDTVELWDVKLKNTSNKDKNISVFSYCEFSFNIIEIDNQNYQMSLYCSGSDYKDGIIGIDNFYNPTMYHYFTSSFTPDSYDCLRDSFIGEYRTESNPIGVENGILSGSHELGNNHCGGLHKKLTIKAGEEVRVVFMVGVGNHEIGEVAKAKYSDFKNVDKAYEELAAFWDKKCSALQIQTPNGSMDTMINTWNLYQSEINIIFSRFASFIEVGGRTGLGYRDTAQDAMCIPHSNPEKCRQRLVELLRGLTQMGYGLHLFEPSVFDPNREKVPAFKSPTVKPEPNMSDLVHGLEHTCSDDALWLIPAISEYIKETGENSFIDEIVTFADGGESSVYNHMKRILDFSTEQVGATGICKGLRADWNDCLNLGGGESALVSFLHYWALENFIELAKFYGKDDDAKKYADVAQKVREACETHLWDKDWYIRGITKNGVKIGTSEDIEGKVHLESNSWAVVSGVAQGERAAKAMDAIDNHLYSEFGIHLNAPSYGVPNDDIGFITRVYKGIKENGAIFSHPNPWAWVADAKLGNGNRAMKFYNSLCPANQNDKIEVRQSEPYSYCQFVMGRDHTAHGRARHPWLTGSAGWAYFAATRYMIGIRFGFDTMIVDPCIPAEWDGFKATRRWRDAQFDITVSNPNHVQKGIKSIKLNGNVVSSITPMEKGSVNTIEVLMG